MIELHLDDVVRLRKSHPCGGHEWRVVRLGVDIGAICTTCGRRIMMPRSKFEKQIKQIVRRSDALEHLPAFAADQSRQEESVEEQQIKSCKYGEKRRKRTG